jgi:septation ring formation regulator EzrA
VCDSSALEDLVRVVGLVTALLGAAAAVPGGVWRLKDRAAAGVKAVQARLTRHPVDVRNVTAHLAVAVTTSAAGRVTVRAETMQARIAELEQRVTEIQGSVREIKDDLRAEIEGRKDADTRLAGEIEELRTALHDLEKLGTEIDAHALPVVVIGILLTSIGDWIASYPWMAGIAIIIGAVASVYALTI